MADPKTKLIAGQSFTIAQPYDEGHVCSAAEAKALNQVRSENIGNNLRKTIEEMVKEGKSAEEMAAVVAEYDNAYQFNLTTVSGARKLDPIEREARAIAKDAIKEHLAKTGRKLTVAPEGETEESWSEKVEAQIEALASREDVVKLAKQRVAAKQKVSSSLLEELGGQS